MKRSVFVCAALLVMSVGMTGCAENPATPAAAPATSWKHAPATTTATTETAASVIKAVVNPSELKFDRMSAKLTPEHEAQLISLMPKLKDAKLITVRGYCYKKDVGNAKKAAQARAISVEKFLVKQGISKKKISRRFNTEDAEHAVHLEIDN